MTICPRRVEPFTYWNKQLINKADIRWETEKYCALEQSETLDHFTVFFGRVP